VALFGDNNDVTCMISTPCRPPPSGLCLGKNGPAFDSAGAYMVTGHHIITNNSHAEYSSSVSYVYRTIAGSDHKPSASVGGGKLYLCVLCGLQRAAVVVRTL